MFCIFLNFTIQAQNPSENQTQTGAEKQDTTLQQTIEDIQKDAPYMLTLEKRGRSKRIRFYTGQRILFKLKKDEFIYETSIEGIGDGYIEVKGTVLPISEIDVIIIEKQQRFLRMLRNKLIQVGLLYFLFDMVNDSFSPSRETAIVSGSFVSSGLLLIPLIGDRVYKLNQHRYLKTIKSY
jgi:hypothetical protein